MDFSFANIPITNPSKLDDLILADLVALNFKRQDIRREGIIKIADLLKKNKTIKYLSLHDNHLDKNCCVFLKQLLQENTTITYLDLGRCSIVLECNRSLLPAFAKNKTLTHIDIPLNASPHNRDEPLMGDIKGLGVALLSNPSLTHLNLHKSKIGEDLGLEIAAVLTGNQQFLEPLLSDVGDLLGRDLTVLTGGQMLQYLDLSSNPIGVKAAVELAQFLDGNKTLQYFSMGFPDKATRKCPTIGAVLGSNTTLRTLELENMQIDEEEAKSILESLKRYSALTKLNLADNNIGNAGAVALGELLVHNSTLVHIDLPENRIGYEGAQAISRGLFQNETLQHLELGTNSIGMSGVKALLSSSSITYLGVASNQVEEEGALDLAKIVLANASIKRLNLANNEVTLQSDFERVVDILLNKPCASEINIDGAAPKYREIKDIGAAVLAQVLSTNTVTKLILPSCGIQGSGAIALASVLSGNTTLKILDLARNAIGDMGCTAIANALTTNCVLTTLDLSQNGIGSKTGSDNSIEITACKALAELLNKNTTITHINLLGNMIEPSGFVELGCALLNNNSIKQLKILDENQVNDQQRYAGVQTVVEIIVNKPIPENIELQGKKIDEFGAHLLGHVLSAVKVTVLNLAKNHLGDAGMIKLCEAIKDNANLTLLNVEDNNIGSEGSISFGGALQRNNALTTAVLSHNQLEDYGVEKILEGAKENRALKSLDLADTHFGNRGAQAIASALQSNKSITAINLTGNLIDEGVNSLLFSLKHHNETLTSIDVDSAKDLQLQALGSLLSLNKASHAKYKKYIPDEAIQSGESSCLQYIGQLEKAKAEYKSMKICVIGDGRGGEPNGLVHFMSATELPTKTKGVTITYPTNLFEGIDASIWDFQNKRKYMTTHGYLLSRNSIYLLCFDLGGDVDRAYNSVTIWLKWLNTHLEPPTKTTTSPKLYKILLVGLHDDLENPFGERLEQLRNSFHSLPIHEEYIRVSTTQQTGRDKLLKAVTDLSLSVLNANPEFDIPVAYSTVVAKCLLSMRDKAQLIKKDKFRKSLAKKEKGCEFFDEEFERLVACLHYSGKIYSYNNLVFPDPTHAVVALTTFICPKASHVLHPDDVDLGKLSTEHMKKALSEPGVTLKLKLVVKFLQSTGLCFVANGVHYFPRMTPTAGIPQFKTSKATQSGVTGTRYFVSSSGYIISHKLFSNIQIALLKSFSEEGDIDLEVTKHRLQIVNKGRKGEMLLVLDRNQLQMHLFVCGSGNTEELNEFIKDAEDQILACLQGSLPFDKTNVNIVKDYTAMQNPSTSKGSTYKPSTSKGSTNKYSIDGELADVVIPFYSLQIKDKIGQGGFGKVKTAHYKEKEITVAVKQLNVTVATSDLEKFKDEIKAMRAINSDYVVKLYGACTDPKLAIVMEYLEGGDLSSLLAQNIELSWHLRLSFASNIAAGIAALHKRNPPMLHCDIKAANILLDKDKKLCKLADFGLATMKASHSKSVARGTLKWMAPELIGDKPAYSIYSDMYAFGMVLWEIASRKQPYGDVTEGRINFVIKVHDTEPIPDGCPMGYKELIEKCWDETPEHRPTAEEALAMLNDIKCKLSE